MSKLTTSELLAMLHKSGMSVSHDQLKHWRRNGLLAKPLIRGKGRGMGVEQLWDEACIENVRLILDSNKGKRMNVLRAKRYLFARARPIDETLLRRYLMELWLEMLKIAKQRKKMANDNFELTELIHFLTPEKVKEAVTQTQANQMLSLYDSMSKFDTPIGAKVALISNCHPVFDVLVQTDYPDLTGINSLSNEAIYQRRRSILAWSVLIHHFGDKLSEIVSHAIQQLIFKNASSSAIQLIILPKN